MVFRSDLSNSEIGIGFSDRIILGVSIIGFTALIYIVHSILGFGSKSSGSSGFNDDDLTDDERLARADVSTLNRAQRRARAKAIMKEERRAPSTAADDVRNGENDAIVVDEDVDVINGDVRIPVPVPSRKERQQNAKLAEKEERRLFQDERERQQKEAQLEAQQLKKERLLVAAKRFEEEQYQKEVKRLAREEKERHLWHTFISSSESTHESVRTVSEFIEDCKIDRLVDIEEMATKYGVEPRCIVDRIKQLLSDGRIAGFFQNNQQRFIYVSDDELYSIAFTVRDRGSISIEQFATICKQSIGL
jgi:DDRGK domain